MFTMLADGSKVEIRAIAAQDASMLQSFVRRLSARSRHFRFFTAFVELPMALLERLVNQDHRRGLALVALGEEKGNAVIIAEARCVLDEAERTAEFAVVVADEFQRRGLGIKLLKTLLAYSSKKGVRRLFGEILADNQPMVALARRSGFEIQTNELDRRTVIASIVPPGPDATSR
jgi:acetyltransferase